MAEWTLEAELCSIAGKPDLGLALNRLGLISQPGAAFAVRATGSRWERSGAETYALAFEVCEDKQPVRKAIIKACVSFAPGRSIDSIVDSWLERREIISANAVSTPTLYGRGPGVIVEEFIENEIQASLSSQPNWQTIRDLCSYAAVLSRCGFAPISPFDDLRSRGSDIVVVDFGQDLGPPNQSTDLRPQLFSTLLNFLSSLRINLTTSQTAELQGLFVSRGGEFAH